MAENIASIQRAKIATDPTDRSFSSRGKGEIKTYLGLEDASRETENLAFLDIIYESGFSFRLRVHSDQEEALLDRQTKDQTKDRYVRTEAAALLSSARWRSTILPLHSQTISTYCTPFPLHCRRQYVSPNTGSMPTDLATTSMSRSLNSSYYKPSCSLIPFPRPHQLRPDFCEPC